MKKNQRRSRPTKLSRLTESLLGPSLVARGFTHSRLVTEWPDIAGEAAAWSEPANIRFPKGKTDDGTLVVNIHSGRGPEMQMLVPGIIEKCNAVFGYSAIGRITLTQVAMEFDSARGKPPAPERAEDPGEEAGTVLPEDLAASPELRDTLDSLGKSIARRQRRRRQSGE